VSEGSLKLDARQRAMLDEMGVKVWWPMAAPAPAEAPAPVAMPAAPRLAREEPAAAQPAAVPPPPSIPDAAPAAPPVVARPAAAPSAASVLIEAPRLLYGPEGAARGGWLIVADMPPGLDGRHTEPFSGDAGRLFEAMLRALQLHTGTVPVQLMRTHRGVASGQPGSPRPIAEGLPLPPIAPQVVLAMGPLAAQSLLQSGDPLGRLRGRSARMSLPGWAPIPLVATYHPAYLLRNPADKARAWADLCLAADQLGTPS
jgi:uracil-DNA glycosylase